VLQGVPLKFGEITRGDLPFYNRILFPSVHHALAQAFPALSGEQWHVYLRVVSYQAAFLAFALVCHFCLQAPRRMRLWAIRWLACATSRAERCGRRES
jgi:hypothetical protein